MRTKIVYLLVGVCVFVAGCRLKSRSISHSGFSEQRAYCGYPPPEVGSDPGFEYRGELSEFDVLGITRGEVTSEAQIQRALEDTKRIRLHPGSSILLIQSGALFPDGPMVEELSRHFTIVPFSGVPPFRRVAALRQTESLDPESYSKSLRLAAARGGNDTIVCYWGVLESESEHLPTKTVSWVPLVHWVVPDEKQHMRIRLKLALVDVRSGSWTVFSPEPFESQKVSTAPRRGAVDQQQVERLKAKAYEAGAAELVRQYARVARTISSAAGGTNNE